MNPSDVLFFLGTVLILSGFSISAYIMYGEHQWSKRGQITYLNFKYYAQFFRVTSSKKIIMITIAHALISIFISYFILNYSSISYLIYFIIPTIAITLSLNGLFYSREKHNKDLSYYVQYHKDLQSNFQSRESLLKNIEKYELNYQDLIKKVKEQEKNINEMISVNQPYPSFIASLDPFRKRIDDGNDYLKNFDVGISKEFDSSLHQYLRTGFIEKSARAAFSYDLEKDIQQTIEQSKNNFSTMVFGYFLQSLNADALSSNQQVISMLNYAQKVGIKYTDEFSIALLKYVDQHKGFRNDVMITYQDMHHLPATMVIDTILKNQYDWYFEHPFIKYYDTASLSSIMVAMIQNNEEKATLKLLNSSNHIKPSILQNTLSTVKVQNSTQKLFDMYYQIITTQSVYPNDGIGTENMAIAIQQYYQSYEPTNSNKANIEKVILNEEYEKNEKMIQNLYHQNLDKQSELFILTNQIIFLWNNTNAYDSLVSSQKTLEAMNDFKKNLNLLEITSLNFIIVSQILRLEKDQHKIDSAYHLLSKLLKLRNIKSISTALMNYASKVQVSSLILNELFEQSNIAQLRKVTKRVENKRLLMDDLKTLAGVTA